MKWILLFFIPQVLWAIDTCDEGWQIPHGSSKIVNCHGICWDIDNNHASGNDIFVPTKTLNEYNAFNNNTPSGVTKAECIATYLPWYPQINIPVTTVENAGWTECARLGYDSSMAISTLQAQCNKDRVLMACRPNNNSTFTLLAQATKNDVFYDTTTDNYTYPAWGTGWYYNSERSLGFSYSTDSVNRNSCDTNTTNNNYRLCRHTGGGSISTGWRCGSNTGISSGWETVWYHSNGVDPEPECNDYKTIQDDTRYYRQVPGPLYCDNNPITQNPSPLDLGKWHRFFNSAGSNFKIPTTPLKSYQAYTHAPGWLEGLNPLNGQSNSRTAYFAWANNSKNFIGASIETRYCANGDYYVYRLGSVPVCNLRYSTIPHDNKPDQCYTYTTINDSTRRTSNTSTSSKWCDNRVDGPDNWIYDWGDEGTWFRFEGGSSQDMIPTSTPPINRCQTDATGWQNYSRPGTYGTNSGNMCFHWDSNSCYWTSSASTTNCDGYYVYQLPRPPGCSHRYCVD
jgi:hypothetical protein